MADQSSVQVKDTDALKEALKLIQPLAKKLASVDKTKLTETEDKFVVIRAIRLDHLIRETLSGKSLRS